MALWSAGALFVLLSAGPAAAGRGGRGGRRGPDGVLAYPAEESRISATCFELQDEFACGWYCAHAFYVDTKRNGAVTLMPFGEGNLVDDAHCSDCSLFEGVGFVEGGDLTAPGAVAAGQLAGGYFWSAYYDVEAAEVIMNFTDYMEPCEIRYLVTAGNVMGVPPAPGRPLKENSRAVVALDSWGGLGVCELALAGCTTWRVRVSGDVADWQNEDELVDPALVCPARVQVYSEQNEEFCGHDGVPRGSDGHVDPSTGEVTATRNTVISFDPVNVTRCEQYFQVVEGCFDGVGPTCGEYGTHDRMASVRAHVAEVRERRQARAKVAGTARGRRPANAPHWLVLARAFEFGDSDGVAAFAGVDWRLAAAGWAAAFALLALAARRWVTSTVRADGYKAVPEARPLLADVSPAARV